MNILYIALKLVVWIFRISNYFCEISKFHDFMNTLGNFAKSLFAHISVKLKYLAKQYLYLRNLQIMCFNPEQAGLFADWFGRGRADSAPFCNFCFYGPIDLKFGM